MQGEITIKRAGDFKVSDSDEYQCGYIGKEDYKYKVEITGKANDLNFQGFLIDNKEIDDYFQSGVEASSCERMVTKAAKRLREICKDNSFNPKRISVEIIASDEASCIYIS